MLHHPPILEWQLKVIFKWLINPNYHIQKSLIKPLFHSCWKWSGSNEIGRFKTIKAYGSSIGSLLKMLTEFHLLVEDIVTFVDLNSSFLIFAAQLIFFSKFCTNLQPTNALNPTHCDEYSRQIYFIVCLLWYWFMLSALQANDIHSIYSSHDLFYVCVYFLYSIQ